MSEFPALPSPAGVPQSSVPRDFPDLPEPVLAAVHARVWAFEDAWVQADDVGSPRPRPGDHLADDPSGGHLLIELVHSDLELRLRAGEPARVEEYLAAYPDLSARPEAVAGLVAAEYRVRRRRDPDIAAAEYARRFPDLTGMVTALLAADETYESPDFEPHEGVPDGPLPTVAGYELLGELGRGGMGLVYKAVETRLKRTVALKTLRPGADPAERTRLKREAEAAAGLAHPNVVPIYAVFEDGPRLYLAMEYLSGGTLAEKIRGEPLPAGEAAALLEPLARAVAYAHANGVVHRDLKPQNVLLAADGTPKVADFGLAKRDGDDDLTRTGVIAGSPAYMAPEQASGSKAVGAAADVWSLGAMLYELLAGRPPFRGASTLDTLDLVRTADPVPPSRLVPRLPKDLETVCLKCLEKEPANRYASADALVDDLARFRRGEPVTARPVGRFSRGLRWAGRNKALTALLVTLAAALIGGTAGLAAYTAQLDGLNKRLGDTVQDRDAALKEQTTARKTAEALLFASDMRAAADAISDGDLSRAAELLAAHASQRDGEYAFVWNHLDRLVHAPGDQIDHLGGPAYFVCFSPDGKTLAACGAPGEVRLYETGTWRKLAEWDAGQGELNGLAFTPDGTHMASAGDDGTVALWDVATRDALWRKKAYDAQAYQVAFGLGGSVLAACGRDKDVLLLDPATGEVTARLAADQEHVESITITPDGGTLLSAGYGGEITARELNPRKQLWQSRPAEERGGYENMSVAVSPDGQLAAFGRRDATVLVTEVATGRTIHDGPFPAGSSDGSWHRTVGFLPDGRLAAVADGGVLRLARVGPDGLAPVSEGRPAWLARPGRIGGITAAGEFVATASRDGVVEAWRPDAERASRTVAGPWGELSAFIPAAGPTGRDRLDWWFWLGPGRERHCLADIETGAITKLPGDGDLWWWVRTASADGRRLFAGTRTGELFGWDTAADPPVQLFARRLPGVGYVSLGDATREGRRVVGDIVRESADGIEVTLFDGDTGVAVASRPLPLSTCRTALDAAGSLAAAAQEAVVLLLDAGTLATRRELHGHQEKVVALALSADGRRVASAGNDREVIVWETATGRVNRRWQADAGAIQSLAFSPDGRLLLTATDAQPARLWDLATGRLLLEPGSAMATAAVEDWAPAAFTGDGRILAGDGTAVVFLDGRPLSE